MEKTLAREKSVIASLSSTRSKMDIVTMQIDTLQRQLEKKQENQEKTMRKIDEIESRYKDICMKNGTTPTISRPDFTIKPEDLLLDNTTTTTTYKPKLVAPLEGSTALRKKNNSQSAAELQTKKGKKAEVSCTL